MAESNRKSSDVWHLGHMLKHEYTNVSLCFNGLKGYDKQVVSHLRHACAEHGFRIYLASFTKEVTGSCEDDSYYGHGYGGGSGHHLIDEEIESSMTLTRLVDLDGNEVTKNLDFDEDKFLINDPFEGAEQMTKISRGTQAMRACRLYTSIERRYGKISLASFN
jgi:hypothetical protein